MSNPWFEFQSDIPRDCIAWEWEGTGRPRIALIIDRFGWAFSNIAYQIERYLADDFEIVTVPYLSVAPGQKLEADIVLCFWWYSLLELKEKIDAPHWLVGIYDFTTWNGNNVKKKPIYQGIDKVMDMATGFFVGNDRLHDYFREKTDKPIFVTEDGVDTELFKLPTMKKKRDLIVGWTGSSRNTDGQLKGINFIREACARERVPILVQDRARNEYISHLNMTAEFYSRISTYICASTWEGTPNPVLESLACGVPVISTDVGLVPKMVTDGKSGFVVERDVESIASAIRKIKDAGGPSVFSKHARKSVLPFDWSIKVEAFRSMFETCLKPPKVRKTRKVKKSNPIPEKIDLKDKVTTFVLTVDDGRNCFESCVSHLKSQDSDFEQDVIRNVAPMNRAFNEMLNRCKTPLFIQVDHDMNLSPEAVSFLVKRMEAQPENVAILCYPLLDTHLDLPIIGVKVYRHSIVKDFPFSDSPSCEMEQAKRLEEAGFRVAVAFKDFQKSRADCSRADCLGTHSEMLTPLTAYEAYRNRLIKTRIYPWINWVRTLPRKFVLRYFESRNPIDLYAALGSISGLLADTSSYTGEKDYRSMEKDCGFERIEKALNDNPDILFIIERIVPEKIAELVSALYFALTGKSGEPTRDEQAIVIKALTTGTI